MFTVETYNAKSKRYTTERKARSRGNAFLLLSLVKGRGRVRDADGNLIARRTDEGKLSLA